METYNYDNTAAPGFGPSGDVTPMLPDGNQNTPSFPGTDMTPSIPSNGNPVITPGFGPSGNVTPALPSTPNGCLNCSGGVVVRPGNINTILWTWGMNSPIYGATAHVRFYNASAIQEPLDIYLNGRLVVSNLDFMTYTNYLHIVPGVYRMTVYRRTNPGFPIIDTGLQFRGNTSYTLAILGTVGDFSVQLITS